MYLLEVFGGRTLGGSLVIGTVTVNGHCKEKRGGLTVSVQGEPNLTQWIRCWHLAA